MATRFMKVALPVAPAFECEPRNVVVRFLKRVRPSVDWPHAACHPLYTPLLMIHEVRPLKWAIAYPDVMKKMFGGKSRAPYFVMLMNGEEKVFDGTQGAMVGLYRRTNAEGGVILTVKTKMPVAWPGETGLFRGGAHGEEGYGFITQAVVYFDMQREMDVLCMREHTVKEMTTAFCKVLREKSMKMYYNEQAAHMEKRAAMAMNQYMATRPAIDAKDNAIAQLEAVFASVRLDESREGGMQQDETETEEEEDGEEAIVGAAHASSERSMWV